MPTFPASRIPDSCHDNPLLQSLCCWYF